MLSSLWQSLRTFFAAKKNFKSSTSGNRTRRLTLRGECLEQREMLSANQITYAPAISAIIIEGTSGADSVTVSTDAANIIHVSMQNATGLQNFVLPALGVTQIRFLGGDGNDVFKNSSAIGTLAFGDGGNDFLTAGSGGGVMEGGSGDDTLIGGSGIDQLYGDDGNDLLDAGDGNDILYGGTGSDTLSGGAGDDDLYGEDGADTLYGVGGDDFLSGGLGNDTLYGNVGADTLSGEDGDDFLYGEQDADFLIGGNGHDYLSGGSENDILYGNAGNDTLNGDDGDDSLYGEDGQDILSGGIGNDFLNGGAHNNVLFGGLGDDTLVGGEGDDQLYGDDGADLLTSGGGNDLLLGGTGDDKLYAGAGNDSLYGGDGNDNLYGEDGNDALYGNAGNDYLGGAAGFDGLYGGIGDDTLEAGDGNDLLLGDEGNDRLVGGLGNDMLRGGSGDDTLLGGAGSDTLHGDDGADNLYGEDGGDVLYGGAGNDYLNSGADNNILFGDAGDDTLQAYDGLDRLFGGDGNDTLLGGGGNDLLQGNTGNDRLFGDIGNDTLIGDEGDDYLQGDDGIDLLMGGANSDALYGGSGTDSLLGGDGNDELLGEAGDDRLFGEAGDDWMSGDDGNDLLDGGDGNDELQGRLGNDLLAGGAGDDKLLGHEGADVLRGGAGADQLFGGADTDVLIGGADKDQLWGEAGDDIQIGGITEYDQDPNSLKALVAAWSSGLPYSTRLQQIQDDLFAAHLELEHSVFDDGAADTLYGGADQDWFLQTGVTTVYRPADVEPYMPMDDSSGHSHATVISAQLPALEGFAYIDSLDKQADKQTTETLTTLVPHSDTPSLQREHLSLFQLVRYADVTNYAVASGAWSNPATWHNGQVPADGAKVLIPIGVSVQVDTILAPRIDTLRVDGALSFNTIRNTELKVDTVVVSGTGAFEMGTAATPIARGVTARLLITDNGAIDRVRDPFGIGRGLISHGKVSIYGSEVTSYVAVNGSTLAGSTVLSLKSIPTGWKAGDTIVLAATVQGTTQNEVRHISGIVGNTLLLDQPLQYSHIPADTDLEFHVANTTRNAVIESETTVVGERGHVMFMHNANVNIGYAGFYKLGRSDKSQLVNDPVVNADWTLKAGTGTNPRARYSVHFHRTGTTPGSSPVQVLGSAVVDSPGWGFVNHSSNVDFVNNVAFDVNGAAYTTEVGDEIGGFYGNIAIGTTGTGSAEEANARELSNDFGFQGDGFWFQGGGVSVIGNVSAGNQENAFFYYTKGQTNGNGGRFEFATANLVDPSIANGAATIPVGQVPIRVFTNNVGYASHFGITVRYHLEDVTHGGKSYIENSKFWNNQAGVFLPYTQFTTVRNDKIITTATPQPWVAITGNIRTTNNTFENLTVSGYFVGIEPARRGSTIITGGNWNNVNDVLLYTAAVNDRNVVISGVPAKTTVTTLFATKTWGDYTSATFLVKDNIVLNYGSLVNQKLYFYEQRPDYIPFPNASPSTPSQLVGLTNQQLSDRFGLPMGGALAPGNAVSVPGIIGLVAPLT